MRVPDRLASPGSQEKSLAAALGYHLAGVVEEQRGRIWLGGCRSRRRGTNLPERRKAVRNAQAKRLGHCRYYMLDSLRVRRFYLRLVAPAAKRKGSDEHNHADTAGGEDPRGTGRVD
jgi:hypothetical protein